MRLSRRHMVQLGAALAWGGSAAAQAQSAAPVTLVVPSSRGGATDFVANLLAHALGERLGTHFEVVNVPGRSGFVGSGVVARSRPDGHTLLVSSSSTFVTAAQIFPNIPYDNDRDLLPLSMLASNALVLCVRRDAQVESLADLLRLAPESTPRLAYGCSGFGSSTHLAMEELRHRNRLSMAHTAFEGGSRAVQGLLGSEIDVAFFDVAVALPYIASQAIRPLAVSSTLRLAQLPEVPTLDEAGQSGFHAHTDFALFAPAETPPAETRRLATAAREVMGSGMMRRRLALMGMTPATLPAEEFPAYLANEKAQLQALLREHPVPPPEGY